MLNDNVNEEEEDKKVQIYYDNNKQKKEEKGKLKKITITVPNFLKIKDLRIELSKLYGFEFKEIQLFFLDTNGLLFDEELISTIHGPLRLVLGEKKVKQVTPIKLHGEENEKESYENSFNYIHIDEVFESALNMFNFKTYYLSKQKEYK